MRNSETKPRSFMSMSRKACSKREGSKAPALSRKFGFVAMIWRRAASEMFKPSLRVSSSIAASLTSCWRMVRSRPIWRASSLVNGRLKPALVLLDRPVVGGAVFLGGDLRPADRGDGRAGEAAQHVAHAPDDEAHDDEPHDHGHDRLADEPLTRVAYRLEHLALIRLPFSGPERALSSGARPFCIGAGAMITTAAQPKAGRPHK